MKAESIAEFSLGAFCNTFDLHYAIIGLKKPIFGLLLEWPLKTGLTEQCGNVHDVLCYIING